ncbi:hypothetical protein F4678DRAFT_443759 [Xylaria arbuscula]|nr:hypothetical protein F4678DRAFT_443759 [Xylaria arbuscula]
MPPKKRVSAEVEAVQSGSRRRSTRLSSTGQKSSYFDDDVDDSGSDGPPRKAAKTARTAAHASRSRPSLQNSVSDDDNDDDQYEDDNVDDEDAGDSDAFDEEDESATPPPPLKSSAVKRRRGPPPMSPAAQPRKGKPRVQTPNSATKKRGRPANASAPRNIKNVAHHGDEDEEDSDDNDDDDDEPRVTFIPLPKLRDANGVDYEDTIIHPNTLLFLGDLKANNKRSWLKMHDPEYRRSLKDWESFVGTLTEKIIEADETIPELPLKDVIFRIYRDIRFSKDPTPYKPHYSAAWSRTGRKGPYACYYVHIEPGYCLVGGGLWHPEAQALAKLRASVDERPHRIRRVLTDPEFVRVFLPNAVGKKEDKILKAFADKNQENALKTKPKGFNPDHRDINLLKLRNYTVGCQIPDDELHGDDAQEKIIEVIRAMVPFITFLNNVVMPDPGLDSDSEEENEEEEGADDGTEDEDEE